MKESKTHSINVADLKKNKSKDVFKVSSSGH